MSNDKKFREIRYEEKKEAMIRSASRAFGRRGFRGTTIEEIANELKMTKGSLYYYFSSKEDILYEVHLLSLNEVLKKIFEINRSEDPTEIKLKRIVTEHLKIFSEHYEGGFMLFEEYALPTPYHKEILSLRDQYQNEFIKIIKEGIKSKVFAVKDVKMAVFCMLGAINWFLRWYSKSGDMTADEIADRFIDFFFHGLLRKKKSK